MSSDDEPTRVLVTGSRDWRDEDAVWEQLMLAYYDFGGAYRGTREFVIVHGACETGVDQLADSFGKYHSFRIERHPAEWGKHGKRAGPVRNQQMVDCGAVVCLAFVNPCRKCPPGICGGPDARHRVLDSIADCVNSTDENTAGGAEDAAEEFGYPVVVCQYIGDHWDGETQMWRLDA